MGYEEFEPTGLPDPPVTMMRGHDVGMIDLHTRVRGPARLVDAARTFATARSVTNGKATFLVPEPAEQILHLVLHDQLHNRDYWKGVLDLRHLCDIAWIVAKSDAVDWAWLTDHFARQDSLHVLASQMLQARELLGVDIPQGLADNRYARWQYRRILLQTDYPALAVPLTLLTVALSPRQRNRDATAHALPRTSREAGRMRGLRKFLFDRTQGKV